MIDQLFELLPRLWSSRAARRLRRERLTVLAMGIIAAYVLTALLVRVGFLGLIGAEPMTPIVTEKQEVAFYTAPSDESWQRWLGTDRQGRSILVRAIASIEVAISVGLVTGLIAVGIGTMLGALAGFFGKWVDDFVVWLYSTLSSVPYLLLLLVLSYSASHFLDRHEGLQFVDKGLMTVYVAFGLTFWVGPCRVIRGEVLKLRESEYVVAALALGASSWRIIFRHVLPNVAHLCFIYFSLVFIGAIKSEVILSFLGLGVRERPSWGIMIDQARAELAVGFYAQIGAATAFMFLLVLAFNIFTDALQDALDPKNV